MKGQNHIERVGIIAPSFPFYHDKLKTHLSAFSKRGFVFQNSKNLFDVSFIFSGSDQARATSFWKFACDRKVTTLWCARGGYGAARILPILDQLTRKWGKPPKKRLAGYSDITALLDYVSTRWGWDAIHAPMPGVGEFSKLTRSQLTDLELCLKGISHPLGAERAKLFCVGAARAKMPVSGLMVGGNLTVVCSLIGTPYEIKTQNKILFLEDTGEPIYRLDRMFNQLLQSGALSKARAIVMGTFSDCQDRVAPGLRPKIPKAEALHTMFKWLAEQCKTPMWTGLPVGHSEPESKSGVGLSPLILGKPYSISPLGQIKLQGDKK
jgi:muramoyltetrapeptide carboxypeptidase